VANGGRHVVPPTLSPNAAPRGSGGRDGGRAQGRDSATARYRPRTATRASVPARKCRNKRAEQPVAAAKRRLTRPTGSSTLSRVRLN